MSEGEPELNAIKSAEKRLDEGINIHAILSNQLSINQVGTNFVNQRAKVLHLKEIKF